MELRVLRYFLAVAREGNITAAANSLHMTQPTLSRQLRDLEEELGQKLLVRGNHRMTLTAEGMFLRKRAEEIVAMADKTEGEFRAMKGDLSGDIYIGGGETDAMNLIAAVCQELQEEHPGIRYHFFSGNAQDVTERLDKGLLDFGLLIQPTDIAKYDYLSLPAKDTWGGDSAAGRTAGGKVPRPGGGPGGRAPDLLPAGSGGAGRVQRTGKVVWSGME